MDLEPLAFLGHKPPSVTGNHFHLYRVAICTISTSMIMLHNFFLFSTTMLSSTNSCHFMTIFFEHSSAFLTIRPRSIQEADHCRPYLEVSTLLRCQDRTKAIKIQFEEIIKPIPRQPPLPHSESSPSETSGLRK